MLGRYGLWSVQVRTSNWEARWHHINEMCPMETSGNERHSARLSDHCFRHHVLRGARTLNHDAPSITGHNTRWQTLTRGDRASDACGHGTGQSLDLGSSPARGTRFISSPFAATSGGKQSKAFSSKILWISATYRPNSSSTRASLGSSSG